MDKWSEIPSSCKSLGKKLCKVNENMPNMVCADHSMFFVSWLIGCGKHEAIEIHKVGYLETKHSSHKSEPVELLLKKVTDLDTSQKIIQKHMRCSEAIISHIIQTHTSYNAKRPTQLQMSLFYSLLSIC